MTTYNPQKSKRKNDFETYMYEHPICKGERRNCPWYYYLGRCAANKTVWPDTVPCGTPRKDLRSERDEYVPI